jgi:hypothetical protein
LAFEQVAKYWGSYDKFEHVRWLNERVGKKVMMAFSKYCGNEIETGWWYSYVSILAEVPVWSERNLGEED